MEEKAEKKERKVTGNKSVLTKYSGIAIIGNLFIMRYLYFHIKKNDVFLVEGEGSRDKSAKFYRNVIPFSRARFLRMLNGENFRMPTDEIEKICGDFSLKEDYFRQTAPILMEIPEHELEEQDWKAFLAVEYFTDFEEFRKDELKDEEKEAKGKIDLTSKKAYILKEKGKEEAKGKGEELYGLYREKNKYYYVVPQIVKERHDKVVQALEYAAKKKWDEYLETSNPVFRVWYYYRYGTGYREDANAFVRLKNTLDNIRSADWKRLNKEEREKAYKLLESHRLYLQALIEIEKFEEEEGSAEKE